MFDILIRGGSVLDGTRAPRFRADIGLRGDRIADVGDLKGAVARQTFDADGLCVAPGFIDVHNHSDGWLLKRPQLVAKTSQGFTTEVIAADGISYAPVNEHTAAAWMFYLRSLNGLRIDEYRGWRSLSDYLDAIAGRNVQNVAAHLPYANIRSLVCGWGRAAVDDFQMRQIRYEVQRGMDEGAVGISTGLDYISQCFATTEELVEACSEMAPYGGLYVTHMRYKKSLLPALREAVAIGRKAGVPVHVSHLKGSSPAEVEQVLEFVDHVARREVDFTFDVYPYQPGSTMLNFLLPYEVWEDGPLAVIDKLQHPSVRARVAAGFEACRIDWDRVHIAWVASKENTEHQGKTIRQFVADRGVPLVDALCDLLIEERLAVLCVVDGGDDSWVRPMLQHDLYMMGSDGIYFDDAVVHPRLYGSAGRLLGPCVRDWRLFTLEEAVYKLSGFAARRFGLADRGIVRAGACADVVVFDPQQVTDRATLKKPAQLTEGLRAVFVNGVLIFRDGQPMALPPGPLPGRHLRRTSETSTSERSGET
ncbi:MAG: amidohydrolase family protein [Pirellulaceae bacterium]